MDLKRLPFSAGLGQYQIQAAELLEGFESADSQAVRFFHQNHPQFRHAKIRWLPRDLPESEIQSIPFDLAGAQLAIARWYDFQSWQTLAEYVAAVTQDASSVFQFESAVEAVINGDLATLESSLRQNPELVRARSTRISPHDPPVHRATLLHYVAANGVEGYRQKSPKNAVEIAKALLQAGAGVDALADMYGRPCTTMSMLVSSSHPAQAGVQVALVETLLDFGAAIEGLGGQWGGGGQQNGSPLTTALAFGYLDAAEALVRRGARVDNLPAAAGLGRAADAARMLPASGAKSRHAALALSAQHGHLEIVRLLLDAGEDPNRYNPEGHPTPTRRRCIRPSQAVTRRWSDCWSSEVPGWTLRTPYGKGRRWAGPATWAKPKSNSISALRRPARTTIRVLELHYPAMPNSLPEGLKKVPPFPPVASKLLSLLSTQNVNISEVAEIIGSDPALTARLLQYVNSAAVASARAITNVSQAVALLGFDRTRQLTVMNAAASYAAGASRNVEMQSCWTHSLATAILADEIAKACQVFSKTVFTAGILHDIGRLALMAAFPLEYPQAIRDANLRRRNLLIVEYEHFGIDHADAGRLLIQSWNLPAEFSVIAGRHHEVCPGTDLNLLRMVHTACQLADALGFGLLPPREESGFGAILDALPGGVGRHLHTTPEEMHDHVENHIKKIM